MDKARLFEEKISGETVFDGRLIRVEKDRVRLQDGGESTREVVRHPGGVAILAVTEAREVYFVRQFRYSVGEVLLELPAGKLEPGEDPAVCAARELEEECGQRAAKLELLALLHPSPGYVSEIIRVYLATGLTATAQNLDPDEFLTVETIPLDRALTMCDSGEIQDAKTLIGLMKYARSLGV